MKSLATVPVIVLLWLMSIASGIGVVAVSYDCRLLADELMELKSRHQALQTEWGRLLLEESALAAYARIEEIAQSRLSMRRPEPGDIRVLEP